LIYVCLLVFRLLAKLGGGRCMPLGATCELAALDETVDLPVQQVDFSRDGGHGSWRCIFFCFVVHHMFTATLSPLPEGPEGPSENVRIVFRIRASLLILRCTACLSPTPEET
jgi:hypothetical protein